MSGVFSPSSLMVTRSVSEWHVNFPRLRVGLPLARLGVGGFQSFKFDGNPKRQRVACQLTNSKRFDSDEDGD
jgi:hypothetical protein